MEIVIIVIAILVVSSVVHQYKTGNASTAFRNIQNPNSFAEVVDEARRSQQMRQERMLRSESNPDPELDEESLLFQEVAAEIDRIASETGGLLTFDLDGDGVVDDEEMNIARESIADRLRNQRGLARELTPDEALDDASEDALDDELELAVDQNAGEVPADESEELEVELEDAPDVVEPVEDDFWAEQKATW